MVELQEAKRALAKGALAKLTDAELKRARLQDLCKLFDGFEVELAAERRETLVVQPRNATVQQRDATGAGGLEEVKRVLPNAALNVD